MNRKRFLAILGIGSAAIWAGVRETAQERLRGWDVQFEIGETYYGEGILPMLFKGTRENHELSEPVTMQWPEKTYYHINDIKWLRDNNVMVSNKDGEKIDLDRIIRKNG